ncbi:MAG: winged helix-turn-helix transcriptional regulator [Clostridia bacterium]|nr:winged helix-turn-helix transcriptional regulator [Clostridia bacterium]
MTTICVLSRDDIFSRFVREELLPYGIRVFFWTGEDDLPIAEGYIWDMDTIPDTPSVEGVLVGCTWEKERPINPPFLWLDRPFRPARLKALLGIENRCELTLPYPMPQRQSVICGQEEIPLTGVEYRLFCAIYEAEGEYVSQTKLHQAVWGGVGDPSVVNVYIHYLRQKLEKDGLRVFRSKRGQGYAIEGFERGKN